MIVCMTVLFGHHLRIMSDDSIRYPFAKNDEYKETS